MPRRLGGLVDHGLNRGVARLALFEKDEDYAALERVMTEAMKKHPSSGAFHLTKIVFV